MIIGFPFSAVQSSAFRISLIFSVPQNQMPRTEAFGEFAGIFDGAVVFFIRGEDFPVTVEAEGFVEEPVGASGKFFAERVQRFVARAADDLAVRQHGAEAELARLGRMNVKEGDFHIENLPGFAVRNRDELDRIADQVAEFLLECQAAEGLNRVDQPVVAVNMKNSLIISLFDGSANHPDHPDHAENVVGVFVCHEEMMDAV